MSDFSNPIFHDETKAREWLETRIWPNGPVCPRCGGVDSATLMKGKTTRPGLYQCNACRKPFTVTVGTLYERSKIPLHKWLAATHLICASKKGISALQVGRLLGLSKKTAWFLCHRIRESLRPTGVLPGMGGNGGIVEADETFIGTKKGARKAGSGYAHKMAVFALVDRDTKQARSFVIDDVKAATIAALVHKNLDYKARLVTDDARYYYVAGKQQPSHKTIRHSIGEYVRGEVHTNTIESFFSVFKRGMKGTYQHCGEQHLHRYLAEFDYRYNNRTALGVDDATRMEKSVAGIVGKRLTYRRPSRQA